MFSLYMFGSMHKSGAKSRAFLETEVYRQCYSKLPGLSTTGSGQNTRSLLMKLLEQIVSISFYSRSILLIVWNKIFMKGNKQNFIRYSGYHLPSIGMFFTCIAYGLFIILCWISWVLLGVGVMWKIELENNTQSFVGIYFVQSYWWFVLLFS